MKKAKHNDWRDRCTDPNDYRPGIRKTILWEVFVRGGEDAVLKANALFDVPIKDITLYGDWFRQWPKWRALGRG